MDKKLINKDSFQAIPLKSVYRSGDDKLLEDFYVPSLSKAVLYERAVGFFSTSILTYAFNGLSEFLKNDGHMRLIIGYPLSDEEYEVLKAGDNLRNLNKRLINSLDELIDASNTPILEYRLKIFFFMIATGRLDIKFAYRRRGMYHEKIGILHDSYGNKILFQGSANETTNAINKDLNYESINLFYSWETEIYKRFAAPYELGFYKLWEGRDDSTVTFPISSELYNKVCERAKKLSIDCEHRVFNVLDESMLLEETKKEYNLGYPKTPVFLGGNKFRPFKHQIEALGAWASNNYHGILKLATGAGKTITSMYAVSELFNKNPKLRICYVVAVPYVALAEQWVKEMSDFNMSPVKCFGSRQHWQEQLQNGINEIKAGGRKFLSVVVVNRTLRSDFFNKQLKRLDPGSLFFVGDECHHHASENINSYLPEARFKMGLSATPFSEKSDFGFDTDLIKRSNLTGYYGNIVAEYSLADALADNVLTPYNYSIVIVELTTEEEDYYIELTKEISRFLSISSDELTTQAKNLIRKRNNIISNAKNKELALSRLLDSTDFNSKSHTLVYVGEGKAEEEETLSNSGCEKQLERISKIMVQRGWKLSKFTAEESKSDRENILFDFKKKNVDALVAMKVLDEGIDIPACERAFITASSTNERQFIQRRGRILRKSPGKSKASIFDFVVLPKKDSVSRDYTIKLVERELRRVMEFVRLASNRGECEKVVKDITSSFGLDIRMY